MYRIEVPSCSLLALSLFAGLSMALVVPAASAQEQGSTWLAPQQEQLSLGRVFSALQWIPARDQEGMREALGELAGRQPGEAEHKSLQLHAVASSTVTSSGSDKAQGQAPGLKRLAPNP